MGNVGITLGIAWGDPGHDLDCSRVLSIHEAPAAKVALWQELARRGLAAFCKVTDAGYEFSRHGDLLCQRLEEVERGECTRLLVQLPPRHSKSYHVSQRFPAWFVGRHERGQVILASYGASLAESHGRKARDLLEHQYWPFKTRLGKEGRSAGDWRTAMGAEVMATGVDGPSTGRGADCLIIDDPVKDRNEADSEHVRSVTWDWYLETARTRLMPGGRIVLCQTRWHHDDLAGRILNSDTAHEWTVLNLPALAEEGDELGREEGQALWPEWYDEATLLSLKSELGLRAWTSLYQQRPSQEKGGIFQRDWFENRYGAAPNCRQIVVSADGAWKTGVSNDRSAVGAWGLGENGYFLLDMQTGKWELHELKRRIIDMQRAHHAHAVLIEDTASGIAAIQELTRETALPIIPWRVSASKTARAEAVSPLFEAGKVAIPEKAHYIEAWIEEHVAFPQGRYDDQVDVTSMSLAYLSQTARLTGDWTKPMGVNVVGRGSKKSGVPGWEQAWTRGGW